MPFPLMKFLEGFGLLVGSQSGNLGIGVDGS